MSSLVQCVSRTKDFRRSDSVSYSNTCLFVSIIHDTSFDFIPLYYLSLTHQRLPSYKFDFRIIFLLDGVTPTHPS